MSTNENIEDTGFDQNDTLNLTEFGIEQNEEK